MAHTKELEDMELLLKPCPFCGSRARVFKHSGILKRAKPKTHGPFYFIGCTDPDCILYCNGRNPRLLFRSVNAQFMLRRLKRRRDDG